MPPIIPRVSPDAEQFEHLATEQSLQDFILRALVLRVLLEAGALEILRDVRLAVGQRHFLVFLGDRVAELLQAAVLTEQCVRAGLVQGEELIFAATKVRANASLDSLIPRLRLLTEEHLAQLEPAEPPPRCGR